MVPGTSRHHASHQEEPSTRRRHSCGLPSLRVLSYEISHNPPSTVLFRVSFYTYRLVYLRSSPSSPTYVINSPLQSSPSRDVHLNTVIGGEYAHFFSIQQMAMTSVLSLHTTNGNRKRHALRGRLHGTRKSANWNFVHGIFPVFAGHTGNLWPKMQSSTYIISLLLADCMKSCDSEENFGNSVFGIPQGKSHFPCNPPLTIATNSPSPTVVT